MTTRSRWLLGLALLLFGIPCAWGADPIDTRCLADGGIAQCTEPTFVADSVNAPVDADMWTYHVCDFAGTFTWREAAWNKVLGGKPLFDPAIVSVSSAFEQIIHNACQIGVTDSGWGYTIPPNILCWTGGSLVQNQKSYREFRRLDFSGVSPGANGCNVPWTETVFAGKWRKLACPKTYATRTKANGDLECWKLPPECRDAAKWATRSRCSTAARSSASPTTGRARLAASRSSASTTAEAISGSTSRRSARAMSGARPGIAALSFRRSRARCLPTPNGQTARCRHSRRAAAKCRTIRAADRRSWKGSPIQRAPRPGGASRRQRWTSRPTMPPAG